MCVFNFIDFKEFVDNCLAFKRQYMELLTPFFNEVKIRECKDYIYSLKFAEWKKDIIWEFLNDDISLAELKHISNYTD